MFILKVDGHDVDDTNDDRHVYVKTYMHNERLWLWAESGNLIPYKDRK